MPTRQDEADMGSTGPVHTIPPCEHMQGIPIDTATPTPQTKQGWMAGWLDGWLAGWQPFTHPLQAETFQCKPASVVGSA